MDKEFYVDHLYDAERKVKVLERLLRMCSSCSICPLESKCSIETAEGKCLIKEDIENTKDDIEYYQRRIEELSDADD